KVQFFEPLHKRLDPALCFQIILGVPHQHADTPHPLALLRARRERPRRRRAAEQRDELAAPHSMTSSASVSRLAGISMPSALAVFRLSTNSNLVGSMTGRSAGLSPFKMRPT